MSQMKRLKFFSCIKQYALCPSYQSNQNGRVCIYFCHVLPPRQIDCIAEMSRLCFTRLRIRSDKLTWESNPTPTLAKLGKLKSKVQQNPTNFLFHSRIIINLPSLLQQFLLQAQMLWPSLFITTCSVSSANALSNNRPGQWTLKQDGGQTRQSYRGSAIEVIAI